MDFAQVLKIVLTDSRVIATAIVCFILMNFASFVARYHKKPKTFQKKKIIRTSQVPSDNNSSNNETSSETEKIDE